LYTLALLFPEGINGNSNIMQTQSRNCFVSYHHEQDQEFVEILKTMVDDLNISDRSLHSDISHLEEDTIYKRVREKMRSCSTTLILVGQKTGHRKWVDWEIWSALRSYSHPDEPSKSFKPHGLIAIFLPTDRHSIPNRLRDNIVSGYAVCIKWENIEQDFHPALELAYHNRTRHTHRIDNTRKRQRMNYRTNPDR
jgi:hypothetical protein